jgi:hypothetical protein
MSTKNEINSQNLLDSLSGLNFDNITIIPNQRITIKRAEIEALNNAINALIYNRDNTEHGQLPEVLDTINTYPAIEAVSLNELKVKINKDFLRLKEISEVYDLTDPANLPANISLSYANDMFTIDITDEISEEPESLYVGIKQVKNTLKIATDLLNIQNKSTVNIASEDINIETDEQKINIDFANSSENILGVASAEIVFNLDTNKTIEISKADLVDGEVKIEPNEGSIGLQGISIKPSLQELNLTETTRENLIKMMNNRVISPDTNLGYTQILFPTESDEDETCIISTTELFRKLTDYNKTDSENPDSKIIKISKESIGSTIVETDPEAKISKAANYCLGYGKVEAPIIDLYEYTLQQSADIALDAIENNSTITDNAIKVISEDNSHMLSKVVVPPTITTTLNLDNTWLGKVIDTAEDLTILPNEFSKTISDTIGDAAVETVYSAKNFSSVVISADIINKLKTPTQNVTTTTTIEGKSTLYSIETNLSEDILSDLVSINFESTDTEDINDQTITKIYDNNIAVEVSSGEETILKNPSSYLQLFHIADPTKAILTTKFDCILSEVLDSPVTFRLFKATTTTANAIIVEDVDNALYTIEALDFTNYSTYNTIKIAFNIEDNTLKITGIKDQPNPEDPADIIEVEEEITDITVIDKINPEASYIGSFIVQVMKATELND